MDLATIERALRATPAAALLTDPRIIRRVIKRHRRLPGLGLQVPHARCYAVRREILFSVVREEELGPSSAGLPDRVILLPRPEAFDERKATTTLGELWRSAYHASVHVEVSRRRAQGMLTDAMIRGRIHGIGQTEFDEIRLVLRHDGLLLPPYDDRETYGEFTALFLELRSFAPDLLRETFPTLDDLDRVDAILAEDVDSLALLEACRPEGVGPDPEVATASDRHPAHIENTQAPAPRVSFSSGDVDHMIADANAARAKGNIVRSALLRLCAASVGGTRAMTFDTDARADIERLAARLDRALSPRGAPGSPEEIAAFAPALLGLARRAATPGIFRRVEARMLFDLQRACLAGERAIGEVDLLGYLASFGRRKLTRFLEKTREIRVARAIRTAARKLPRTELPEVARERVADLLDRARHRADTRIRAALRPALAEALRKVGLNAKNVPERVAGERVVEDLLDMVTAHGSLSIGHLRDAISRNQLKLPDLTAPDFVGRDPLLRLDRLLSESIDGVYRRGEIYLRGLQKLASLFFGTKVGRAFTLYLVLPFGAAFVLLSGISHILYEILKLAGVLHKGHHLHLATYPSVAVTGALLFALMHLPDFRHAMSAFFQAIGKVFAAVFVHFPVWLANLPVVLRIRHSRAVSLFRRYAVKPGIAAAAVLGLLHRAHVHAAAAPIALLVFVAISVALNTRAGALAEEIAFDAIARSLRRLRKQVLPGLLRLIVDFFRMLTDGIDRAIYAVDEWLRFGEGQSKTMLGIKAVLGAVWFFVAYLLRIYVNLLIEPQLNPLKHFPVVTVAAKIIFPMGGQILPLLEGAVAPLIGRSAAKAITPLNFALLPGFFGFLVWEFRENYHLYESTREPSLRPVRIGHHGETMGALMKPGFHSGTLPKLYAKLRRAVRRGEEATVERHGEALREIEEAVARFVDREFVTLLRETDGFRGGIIRVGCVTLASNRVKVELTPDGGRRPCEISFEEQSGWLVASCSIAGFTGELAAGDRAIFENTLAGLYKLAGVDLVREQIEAALLESQPLGATTAPHYDISDEGLVVWLGDSYQTEFVFNLEASPLMEPIVRGEAPLTRPKPLNHDRVVFREQTISWASWVQANTAGSPLRITRGDSLLAAPGTDRDEQQKAGASHRPPPGGGSRGTRQPLEDRGCST